MLTHEKVVEQLPALALGALEEGEAAEVRLHLAACASRRAELAALKTVTGQLGLAVPQAALPAGLRSRLMERISARQPARPARSNLRGGNGWEICSAGRCPCGPWGWPPWPCWWFWRLIWCFRPVSESRCARLPGRQQRPPPMPPACWPMSTDGEYGSLVVDGIPDLDARGITSSG